MPSTRPNAKPAHIVLTLLLVMALLFAQWAGLRHRIAHGGGQNGTRHALSASGPGLWIDWSGKARHSCAAWDAAALADTAGTVAFIAPILPNVHVLALWTAFASWDAPLVCHFLSRAPPRV